MSTITVYQTDADGAFLHPVLAHELARSPGTYNVPFGARLNAPPDVPAGQVAVAVGDDWISIEDHRQDTFYVLQTGAPYDLKATIVVGDSVARYAGLGPIPDWLTTEAPVSTAPEEAPPMPQPEA